MPMRILHIVTYMGRGGLETMLMNYYRHMDRDKVQFDFLVHRNFEADYDGEILSLGGKIYRLPPLNPVSSQYLSALDRFFREHREYTIVHSHLDCMAGIPLIYAKKHGIPVRIAHAHSSSQTKDHKYILKLIFKQSIPRYANRLFACSESAGRWMFGEPAFRVLNNAIDAQRFAFSPDVRKAVREELGIPENTLTVGHVGRFMNPKNHSFLLDIFSKLPASSVLLLVGDGALRNAIRKKAADLGVLDRVIFAGVRSDVDRLLQAMDVFVFPSLYEGLAVSTVEAQAAGLPCLVSDKVSMECDKTGLVHQLKLSDSLELWAAEIQRLSAVPRENTYEAIQAAGFDIQAAALWLQQYYLEAQNDAHSDHLYPGL